MSLYPAAVRQGLYEASTTKHHKPGTVNQFDTDLGIVEAVYVTNAIAGSIASGTPVHLTSTDYGVATAGHVVSTGALPVVGVLCASLAASSDGGGAWAAYRGRVTAIKMVGTTTSGAINALMGTVHSVGGSVQTVATTLAIGSAQQWGRLLGNFGGATSDVATSGGAGLYLNLWR
jgi:hypothetical protein